MTATKPKPSAVSGAADKSGLHPRNRHRGRYDFEQLVQASPDLSHFVKLNEYHDQSIDFSNPKAVKALNRALLLQHYAVQDWDIPAHYLCPPIPGRADYLHYIADLLAASNGGSLPSGASVQVLDIGVGANAVYPLIGHREYGWRFVGSDIDPVAIANAQRIVDANAGLPDNIALRLQGVSSAIFRGVIRPGEAFDLTLCNPPFHASPEAASQGSRRKWQNLGKGSERDRAPVLNFGGQGAELYCEGGEAAFVTRMINESAQYASQCYWFTTLISKEANLPGVYRALQKANAAEVKTLEMAQGQKKSRVVAWTFLNAGQRQAWRNSYWQQADKRR